MTIALNKPFAGNAAVDEFDVRQVKHILNRLGYYTPHEKSGMTSVPDRAVFTALQNFQAQQNLPATGTIKPGDETEKRLNSEAAKVSGYYIWRSVQDDRVRPAHAQFDGTIRSWDDSPDPTEEYNCRCWADIIHPGFENPKNRIPIPPRKPNCDQEEKSFEQAKKEFFDLDRRRTNLEDELDLFEKQKEKLQSVLKSLLGANIVPWLLTLPLPVPHVIMSILQRFFSYVMSQRLMERAQKINDEYVQLYKEEGNLRRQLELVKARWDKAAMRVIQTRQQLSECKANIKI